MADYRAFAFNEDGTKCYLGSKNEQTSIIGKALSAYDRTTNQATLISQMGTIIGGLSNNGRQYKDRLNATFNLASKAWSGIPKGNPSEPDDDSVGIGITTPGLYLVITNAVWQSDSFGGSRGVGFTTNGSEAEPIKEYQRCLIPACIRTDGNQSNIVQHVGLITVSSGVVYAMPRVYQDNPSNRTLETKLNMTVVKLSQFPEILQ